MIGFLSGTIQSKSAGQIILLVSGVGYLVTVPPNYLNLLKVSAQTELFIYTHVREDTLDLYGFFTPDELELFKLTLTVSGIGPKTALLVIDKGVGKVEQAIKDADTNFFTTVPRLGHKNAQKIIIELKNKLGGLKELDLTSGSEEVPWQFSDGLKTRLENLSKTVEFYTYEGDNHNLSNNLSVALKRSVDFFDKYLK